MHSPTALDAFLALRKDLLTGKKYKMGEYLNKEELAQQYQVSRGSITHALHKLEMEDLVASEQNRRMRVIGISAQYITDMYDVRVWLEKKAMETLLREDYVDYTPLIQVMNSMQEEMNKGEDADPVIMAQLGFNIHVAMFQICGNRAIFQAWKPASGIMQEIVHINGFYSPAEETYRKHKVLYDSIIQKWPNALQVIEEHIMTVSRDVYHEFLKNNREE